MRHSTGKPTAEEAARIVACKEGPCLACFQKTGHLYFGCDYHHMLSGSRRRGHMFGIGLCEYHHRGVILDERSRAEMREWLGPSLMDGSKPFHAEFGSDEDLLALQETFLG